MAVIRVEKNKNYTCMANYHLRDKELSLKAKGLLSVILSLPDDWKYSMAGLVAICKEGESAVKAAFKELEKAGYVTVTKLYPNQTDTGRIEYVYTIREHPQQDGDEQGIENLGVESQGVENRGQLNTDKPSTKESSTKKPKKKESKKLAETFDSIIAERTNNPELANAIGEFIRMRSRIKKPLTDYALQLRLNKLWRLADTDEERIAIVEQSIGACWQDFFPLKGDRGQKVEQTERMDLGLDRYTKDKAREVITSDDGTEEIWY